MTTISAQTTFTISAALTDFEESADILLLPENAGVDNVYRELHYPGNLYPPLIYPDTPDETVNFDSVPLTARPQLKTEKTIAGTKTAIWPGYLGDNLVQEIWKGSDKISRLEMYFLRRFIEYFMATPASGFVKWIPKDRGDTVGYWIRIFGVTAGGSELKLNQAALYYGLAVNEIIFSFQIVGVAS